MDIVPIAIIVFRIPAPKTKTSIMANRMPGKAISESINRIKISSTFPPKYPADAPIIEPKTKEKNKKIVIETMEKCGLRDSEAVYNKYPHELSGGMQQRIVIAMSLIANPYVLIADEPTTALDANIGKQIIELFEDISKLYNGAILFISHDLNLIERISKRVLVMYAGRIVESADTPELIKNPLHPYTKALIKAVPSYKKRGEKLYNIRGKVPALKNRSNEACPFWDRCDFTKEICKEKFPESTNFNGHIVHCHLFGDENGRNTKDWKYWKNL